MTLFLIEYDRPKLALIPNELAEKFKSCDGYILNYDACLDKVVDLIKEFFGRTGLEKNYETDLQQYLDPKAPFQVDHVIRLGWLP